jgi:hypothetical protein
VAVVAWLPVDGVVTVVVVVGVTVVEADAACAIAPPVAIPTTSNNIPANLRIMCYSFSFWRYERKSGECSSGVWTHGPLLPYVRTWSS